MKTPLGRIYHPWSLWEDYQHNFHGGMKPFDKVNAIDNCANLLKDLVLFEECLVEITNNWKHSCEHNLTNEAMNRIAYLGQASHALRYNVPSNISMGAYSTLTADEQKAADKLAEKYLNIWLETHVNSKKVS